VSNAPQVLLVDDNPADIELARQAFAGGKYKCRVHSEEDGEQALAYLRRSQSGEKNDAARPDLIFLDLNLPGKDGWRVLEEMKRDPDLCRIPVIIFSTSQSTRDVKGCYEAGANCYVNKPARLEDFFSAVRSIEQFWFGSALLPEEGHDGIACKRSVD
jgi:two-component system, chemotaxis family, response regulator Rcp1